MAESRLLIVADALAGPSPLTSSLLRSGIPAENVTEIFSAFLTDIQTTVQSLPVESGIRVLNRSSRILERLFDDGFASGVDSICIIGTSAPQLPVCYILEAFGRLTQHRDSPVIGPTKTGGYYLIGASGVTPYSLLKDISRDVPNVLTESLQRAIENELSVTLLPSLDVVETQEQLKRLSRDLRREVVIAPQTQYILRKIRLE
jgi:glycosyltransferase A (GT-A) superfamily protein (DUF2064 family)